MLQHRILWFRHRNILEAYTAVEIERSSDAASQEDAPLATGSTLPGGDTPLQPPTVGRLALWSAALRMWRQRPLLGVGPDNFRHLYGPYLELPDWDRRLHANNLYLELLAGWGLAGALTFGALGWVIARRWLNLWRRASGAVAIWSLGLGGSFLAFFIHGFLDYFLEFVPLYLLFWTVAALIVALDSLSNHLLVEG
jgi:O-antigen ligase